MTPKEQAEKLVLQFVNQAINFPYIDTQDGHCIGSGYMTYNSAKQCALIAVEEIWRELESERVFEKYDFWQQVRQEIEKL